MAYDEGLTDRIRSVLDQKGVLFDEKKMFGGLCILVDDKMCIGIIKDEMMARIGEEAEASVQGRAGVRPMDFTGKKMKGFTYVNQTGLDREEDLEFWIDLCLEFNPKAKSSKKKK
ncbi:MAG: TfoX family protein [Balneola sp.]|nr:MAG: TfoX family protein [Balneola sp.]